MKKLPKDKRDKLLMIAIGGGLLLACLWNFVIVPQRDSLQKMALSLDKAKDDLSKRTRLIKATPQIQIELAAARQDLDNQEAGMASGDLKLWVSRTADTLIKTYTNIEFVTTAQVFGPDDRVFNLLPTFPYKQASFDISGKADYYELGKFFADFENRFPYARLFNITIGQLSFVSAKDREKLSFSVKVVALCRPDTT